MDLHDSGNLTSEQIRRPKTTHVLKGSVCVCVFVWTGCIVRAEATTDIRLWTFGAGTLISKLIAATGFVSVVVVVFVTVPLLGATACCYYTIIGSHSLLLLYPYWGPQPVVIVPLLGATAFCYCTLLGATACCYCTIIGGHSLLLLYLTRGHSLLLLYHYWGPQPVVIVPLLGATACCYCTIIGGHSLLLLCPYWGPQPVVTAPLLGATVCC